MVVLVLASLVTADSDEFVTVATDGGPGGCEASPDICRLKDGRFICVYYAGYDHVSLPNKEHPKGGAVAAEFFQRRGKDVDRAQDHLRRPGSFDRPASQWTDHPQLLLPGPSQADGSTLVVYYEEGAGSNIRAKRFTIDNDGVRFLAP